MRSFVLLAATAALIAAGADGCSRRPRPLRPHKEPHALAMLAPPLAQNPDHAGPVGQVTGPGRRAAG